MQDSALTEIRRCKSIGEESKIFVKVSFNVMNCDVRNQLHICHLLSWGRILQQHLDKVTFDLGKGCFLI